MEFNLEIQSIVTQLSRFNRSNNCEDEFCVDSASAQEKGAGKSEEQQLGSVENASIGKKLSRDSMVLKSVKLPVKCSRGKGCGAGCSKGKTLWWSSEVEELKKLLKVLEEETKTMKEALLGSMEEKNSLMKEIYQHFRQLYGVLFPTNFLIGEHSSDRDSSIYGLEDEKVGMSLSEILWPESNPSLVTRDLRANTLTVEEVAEELRLLSEK